MKQRYTVQTAPEADRILIREEAELDKDLFSTQCSVSFPRDILREALGQGVFPAVQLIRSKDFYPVLSVAEKIVEAIRLFFEDDAQPVAMILILSPSAPNPPRFPMTTPMSRRIAGISTISLMTTMMMALMTISVWMT